eukprot:COSAG01_NODE_24961_length_760_cov_1.284418_1_plen_44_part_10
MLLYTFVRARIAARAADSRCLSALRGLPSCQFQREWYQRRGIGR